MSATSRPVQKVGEGTPVIRFESLLKDTDSAFRLANLIFARWCDDTAWDSPTITIRHDLLTPAESAQVGALEPGDVLITEGAPTSPNNLVEPNGTWKVEGYKETWNRTSAGKLLRTQQFAVSDARRWRTDPGQLTRVTASLVTPSSQQYPGLPLRIRFTAAPADGLPPERPMTSTFDFLVDGKVVFTSPWTGTEMAQNITDVAFEVGVHTITVRYNGVWGFWSPSEQQLTLTVTPATPVLKLTITPQGPIGTVPIAKVFGTPAGASVNLEMAEEGAPDEWFGTQINIKAGTSVALAGLNRPLRFRVRYTPHNGNYLEAVSNVVGFGYTWAMVKADHATWADVKASRATWADLEARA